MPTIIVIERPGKNKHTFVPSLERKGFEVLITPSGKQTLLLAKKKKPDLIVLDAASLGTTGNRICSHLQTSLNGVPVIHVRSEENRVGDEKAGPGDISLDMPFTSRKLINRVERLLSDDAGQELVQGPIKYNIRHRMVRAHGREKRLTPKCAGLLEQFMRHPGETLNRSFLMKKVWKTDYVGDTRTLDVHVRWLREAIEPKPATPGHIVTVRGIGYRFEPKPPSARPKAKSKTTKPKAKSKTTRSAATKKKTAKK
jgi:DNA-binding response OmpR family regulator